MYPGVNLCSVCDLSCGSAIIIHNMPVVDSERTIQVGFECIALHHDRDNLKRLFTHKDAVSQRKAVQVAWIDMIAAS